MRTLLLTSLALLFCCGAQAIEIRKIPLTSRESAGLERINQWLDSNLSVEDCPDRLYFAIVPAATMEKLLGYEVLATCPDAPVTQVPLYFDRLQRFKERP